MMIDWLRACVHMYSGCNYVLLVWPRRGPFTSNRGENDIQNVIAFPSADILDI